MMEDVSDEVILKDLEKKSEQIKQSLEKIKLRMQKGKQNQSECWEELKKKLDSSFIQKGEKKGWAKYLNLIRKPTSSVIEKNFYALSFHHTWVAKITNPENRKTLENLAKENFLSLLLRLREILVEIYDYERYSYPREAFENLSKNIRKSVEDFPLLTFIFSYYPMVFFHPTKEMVDSLDFVSLLKKLDSNEINQKQKEMASSILMNLEKLLKYIDAFSVYESFLFYSEKWYRDHLLHSIRVMWMMEKIIWDKRWYQIYKKSADHRLKKLLEGKSYANKISFPDIYSHDNEGGRLENECLRNGLIAGLFHDLMYPVSSLLKKREIIPSNSKMSTEIENLGKVVVPFLENKFLEDDLQFIIFQWLDDMDKAKQEIKQLNTCYTNQNGKKQLANKFLKHSSDHGVLSGIQLESLPLESRQAIALHNIKNVKIDPMEAPIAFFLVLCDETQEWGRWVKSDKNPEEFFVPCEKIQWEVDNGKFLVKVSFKEKENEIKRYKPNFSVKKLVNDKFKSLSRLIVPEDFEIKFSVIDLEGDETTISGTSCGWKRKCI